VLLIDASLITLGKPGQNCLRGPDWSHRSKHPCWPPITLWSGESRSGKGLIGNRTREVL